jgi:uncharacterized protein (DUF1330 family)
MERNNRDSRGRFIKGHKPTPEMIEKERISHLGKTHIDQTKKKISKSKKGQTPWNKGIEDKDRQGENHHNWNGGKHSDKNGYIWIYSPNHPNKSVRNYVLEHRLAMEKHLGRYLEKHEVVHHINGNRSDNRLDNLVLYDSHSNHMSCHKRLRDSNGRFI